MPHYANYFCVTKYTILLLQITLKVQWYQYILAKEIVDIKFKGNLLIIISISKYYRST